MNGLLTKKYNTTQKIGRYTDWLSNVSLGRAVNDVDDVLAWNRAGAANDAVSLAESAIGGLQ